MSVTLDPVFRGMARMVRIVRYRVLLPMESEFRFAMADRAYRRVQQAVATRERTSDLVVVVHVHYPEVWPRIREQLELLTVPHDLVVSVSSGQSSDLETIARDVPRETVVSVPNLGRDVLPFIRLGSVLDRMGYVGVLKLHSKRSVHAEDGAEFLDDCLSSLLPSEQAAQDIWEVIASGQAAMVGPSGRYYPALVHVWHNIADLRAQLRAWRRVGNLQLADLRPFGFFAGTMFWARFDAIRDCFDVGTRRFQVERGQIDGTMAHALERLFCVLPEIDGQPIYSSTPPGVQLQPHADARWPDWAVRRSGWE